MPPIPRRKTERAPAVDRLLKPAIGVVLAMMAYLLIRGLQAEIPRVDVEDELVLRDVFFGEGEGKNYVVLCHTPSTGGGASLPVSSVFQDAKNDGSVKAEFVLLDCSHVLPSNKTVADRFDIDLQKRPTIFVSGKTGPPRQVPLKHLKTGGMLVKLLRGLLEPHAAKIENTSALKTKCLGKDMCGLFLKGGQVQKYVKDTVQNLMAEYPQIQFASIDSNVLLLSNLENTEVPELTPGYHRFILFKKVSGSLEVSNTTDSSRLISSLVPYQSRDFTYSPLKAFVQDAVNGKYKFGKLSALPAVKTRTKKAEELERQKRERVRARKEQERLKQQQQQEQPTQGAFSSENTKESRKANRDKLREEYMPKLTPEEMAERERLRRERMEEEAQKWNILAAEDDEEEEEGGETEGGEDASSSDEEDDEDLDEEEDLDDEDEDVMDLD